MHTGTGFLWFLLNIHYEMNLSTEYSTLTDRFLLIHCSYRVMHTGTAWVSVVYACIVFGVFAYRVHTFVFNLSIEYTYRSFAYSLQLVK